MIFLLPYILFALGTSAVTISLWVHLIDIPYNFAVLITMPWHIYVCRQAADAGTYDQQVMLDKRANQARLIDLITDGRRQSFNEGTYNASAP